MKKIQIDTKKRKILLLRIGIVLCICIFLVAGFIGLRKYLDDVHSEEEYKEIKDKVVQEAETQETPVVINGKMYNPELPLKIDFSKLKKINPDIVAWLYVPSVNISYPVLQGKTNDDYLHTTAERVQRFAGSIFLDVNNRMDFSDPNTIIYGHNMTSGIMFGRLWKIVRQNVAQEEPYFWIYTPSAVYKYQMFSAFETTTVSKVYQPIILRDIEFRNWCYEMQSWSYVNFGTFGFDRNSKIVTLSTCRSTSLEDRTVVLGFQNEEFAYYVDVRQEETQEPTGELNKTVITPLLQQK